MTLPRHITPALRGFGAILLLAMALPMVTPSLRATAEMVDGGYCAGPDGAVAALNGQSLTAAPHTDHCAVDDGVAAPYRIQPYYVPLDGELRREEGVALLPDAYRWQPEPAPPYRDSPLTRSLANAAQPLLYLLLAIGGVALALQPE